MRRIFAAVAVAGVTAALTLAAAGPATADPVAEVPKAPKNISVADCVIGFGVPVPSATSPTKMKCYGGHHNDSPVAGF